MVAHHLAPRRLGDAGGACLVAHHLASGRLGVAGPGRRRSVVGDGLSGHTDVPASVVGAPPGFAAASPVGSFLPLLRVGGRPRRWPTVDHTHPGVVAAAAAAAAGGGRSSSPDARAAHGQALDADLTSSSRHRRTIGLPPTGDDGGNADVVCCGGLPRGRRVGGSRRLQRRPSGR